jgi:hypothetical protein
MQQQGSDWKNYLAKWLGVFFQPELDNVGGWVEMDYADPTITAERFKALIPLMSRRKLLVHLENRQAGCRRDNS